MELDDYQQRALTTDQVPGDGGNAILVPLLGLAGEAGTLVSEYKKFLRDGDAHRLHRERVAEELGDLLWYLSNVASKYGLQLDVIATANLAKMHGRWTQRGRAGAQPGGAPTFDGGYPDQERLPRAFELDITETGQGSSMQVQAFIDGQPFGHNLTDNAYHPDGYRFHDAFHLAYAAVLGWSPITRALLCRKRKSNPTVDEVEDGGRSIILEEAVAAIAFDYAKDHAFLEGVTAIDAVVIKTIMSVTSHLEVSQCSAGEWEMAIFMGFDTWRKLMEHRRGRLAVNLNDRSLILHSA